MKLTKIAIFTLALTSFSFAQDKENLLDNGGFETVEGKVKKRGYIDAATDWASPTEVPADLFEKGNRKEEIQIPLNFIGEEKGYDESQHYAGFVAYSHNNRSPRSYISGALKTKMKKDAKYCVKFQVSLADLSKYSVKDIAAVFSKKYPGKAGTGNIEVAGDVFAVDYVKESYGWTEICGTYTAKGGEKYITIGNFNSDSKGKKVKKPRNVEGMQEPIAYYYLDNVEVTPITSFAECACQTEEDGTSAIYSANVISNKDLEIDKRVMYSTVYFSGGSTELVETSEEILSLLAETLQNNPTVKLKIVGHSDATEVEKAATNTAQTVKYVDVAQRRVDAVLAYLVDEKKIDESRFQVVIKNADEPAGEGDSEIDLAKNRRVQFILL